jgi:hypothetical protein
MTKLLVWDTEMFPATAHLWDLRVQGGYVPYTSLVTRKKLACVAAKFVGDDEPVHFWSSWNDGMDVMCQGIWKLLDQCDGSVTFNGARADEKWVTTEFLLLGMGQPSDYKIIDLYAVLRRKASFMSNSLAYVTNEMGVRNKTDSGGMATIVAAMDGEQAAQCRLAEYCQNDVLVTEDLLHRIKGWIPGSMIPNAALLNGDKLGCPICGGLLRPRGYSYTRVGKFRRFCCDSCHRWSRSTRRDDFTEIVAC